VREASLAPARRDQQPEDRMPTTKHIARKPRRALRVDPARKAEVQRRLKRIEGQVRGLQRMVNDERYCADILMQVASVQRALSSAGKVLLRNHLEHCVTDAIRSDDPRRAEGVYDEVIGLLSRYTET
jgi:DNA-binding FrmR family transcriptional regulator